MTAMLRKKKKKLQLISCATNTSSLYHVILPPQSLHPGSMCKENTDVHVGIYPVQAFHIQYAGLCMFQNLWHFRSRKNVSLIIKAAVLQQTNGQKETSYNKSQQKENSVFVRNLRNFYGPVRGSWTLTVAELTAC